MKCEIVTILDWHFYFSFGKLEISGVQPGALFCRRLKFGSQFFLYFIEFMNFAFCLICFSFAFLSAFVRFFCVMEPQLPICAMFLWSLNYFWIYIWIHECYVPLFIPQPLPQFSSDFYFVLGERQSAGTVCLVVNPVLLRR